MSNPNVGKVFNMTGGNGGDGSLKLENISVTKLPNKTTYKSGESFDPTGMVVTGLYAYGITSEVTGYTVSPSVMTDGLTQVTITYTEGRITKSTTINVVVEKVLTSITVTTPPGKTSYNYLESFVPSGMVVTANFSDESHTQVTGFTYPTGEFTTLGNQPVTIGYTYEGVTKETEISVTVNAIQLSVPTQKNVPTYDGSQKTPEWNNFDALKMERTGDLNGINAKNNYSMTFTLVYGYVFPGGENEAIVQWAIKRQTIPALPVQVDVPAADGTTKSPSWSGYDNVKMVIGGDQSGTEAGDYTATFTPTSNYMWWDETTGAKNATWSIASVIVTIPVQKNIPTYDGANKSPEWDHFDTDNSTIVVSPAKNAGEYDAVFTLVQGMWEDGTTTPKTIKWKINRANLGAVPAQSGTLTYDGNPKTPSWNSDYDANKMDVAVTAQTLAGTDYTATFTPKSNYQWPDGEIGGKTATWVINKASYTPSATPSSITLGTAARTGSFVVSRQGNGAITAQSSNTGVVTVGTINQNTGEVPVSSVNDENGDVTITINIAESANYLAASFIVTVKAQFTMIWGVEWDWTSSGPTNGVRTDAAVGLADPVPAVNNGTGSSPFDAFYPWNGLVKENRAGGVEVKEPKYWFKWTKTGKKLKLQIANGPVEGFHVDPVNADHGDGLGELDFSYIGRYHCASDNWKSETNKAQKCSITRSAARTGVRTLGSNFQQIDFCQFWYVGMLFLVEFADWNGEKIGRGCSASGSKENNGKTDAMQYHTGTTAANRDSYGYTQYRNIEGWWDNVYDWMDGCYYNGNGLNVIMNPANWSDSSGGVLVGKPTSGYPSEFAIPTQSGLEWALYPIAKAGSTTTYVPDYWNYYSSYPCLYHGGYYGQYQDRGPFFVNYNSTSNAYDNFGCRLQERPPKAA